MVGVGIWLHNICIGMIKHLMICHMPVDTFENGSKKVQKKISFDEFFYPVYYIFIDRLKK